MARTATTEITGFAHCLNGRCAGYSQTEVLAHKDVVEHTYLDSGGDMPGVEKSQTYFRFAEEADSVCPECNGPREVTDQKRIVYQPLSGHSQTGLLQYKPPEVPV